MGILWHHSHVFDPGLSYLCLFARRGNTPPTRVRECGFSSSSTRQESSSFSIHGGEIDIILDRAQFASDRETVACLVYVNIRNRQGRTRRAEVRVASDVQDKVDGSRRRSRVGRKGGIYSITIRTFHSISRES